MTWNSPTLPTADERGDVEAKRPNWREIIPRGAVFAAKYYDEPLTTKYMDSLESQLAAQSSRSAASELEVQGTINGLLARIVEVEKERDSLLWLRRERNFRNDWERDGYWAWQGDGTDALESLTCAVAIPASDLRAIFAAQKEREQQVREEVIRECAAAVTGERLERHDDLLLIVDDIIKGRAASKDDLEDASYSLALRHAENAILKLLPISAEEVTKA